SIASVTPARRLRRWSIAQPTQSRRACTTDVARCDDCYRVWQASRPVAAFRTDNQRRFQQISAPDFYAYDGGMRFTGPTLVDLIKNAHVQCGRSSFVARVTASLRDPDNRTHGRCACIHDNLHALPAIRHATTLSAGTAPAHAVSQSPPAPSGNAAVRTP
ncbi:MAG: hypothetical protein JWO52_4689, partial [Gammaproteobacteria bacterium]|nr:hypothetical protein [Gammaproteobacteria bacterium]